MAIRFHAAMASALFLTAGALLSGCNTQVYTQHYIGVYDVEEQTTQELYRITIKGTATALSKTDYASGWVPSEAADLLGNQIGFDKDNGEIKMSQNKDLLPEGRILPPTRRYYEMGPMGVTQNPQDGRFVIVMSSNPDHFFKKMAALTKYGQEEDGQQAKAGSYAKMTSDLNEKRVKVKSDISATQLKLAEIERALETQKSTPPPAEPTPPDQPDENSGGGGK